MAEAGFTDVNSERVTVAFEFASGEDYSQYCQAVSASARIALSKTTEMLSKQIQRVALHALASSKKTTATPPGMTFGEDWDSMLPGASKEKAKKIFDLFASEGALFGLSPIIVPLVREGPLKPLSIFQLEDLDFLYRRSASDHGEYRY